jgi:RNA polymerase sigma factor (sigma-70 family)
MATSTASVVRALRAAVRTDWAAVSDRELLRRFTEDQDQEAFAALVRRHGSMVLGVCRRALPTAQDAEDACQATFLVLVKKAPGQPWQPSVANWLYATALRVCGNARQAARRRQKREGRAAVPEAVEAADQVTGKELLAALDEELGRLPARYREPLLLCYLEGLTRDEAAGRLGVPSATLKSQLERGRKRLAEALVARGCGLGAGLLALAATSPAGASPPRLVEAVLASATGTPPAAVAALAKGVSMNALLNRSLWVLLAAAAAAWLAAGVSAARRPAAEGPKPARALPAEAAEGRAISGRVVGPDGKPVAGAAIVLGTVESEEKKTTRELAKTDEAGRFRCVVPAQPAGRSRYRVLVARAPGFAADWVGVGNADLAKPVVLRLARAVPVRGRVLTLEGKPVPGAAVRVWRVGAHDGKNGLKEMYEAWAASPNEAASLLQKLLFYPAAGGLPEKVTAGADGRFEIKGAGDGQVLSVEFSAPTIETVIARIAVDPAFDPKAVRPDPKKIDPSSMYTRTGPHLYGPTFDHTARPCRVITGTVFDQRTKKPLPGVAITGRVQGGWWELGVYTKTDAAGRFRLAGLPNANCELTFGSSKPTPYLMLTRSVPATEGLAPAKLDMPLVRGTVVTGRVTDKTTGKPIKGNIRYASLSGNKHVLDLPGTDIHGMGAMTYHFDADGRFRFVAPLGPGIIVVQAAAYSGEEKPYPQTRIRAEDKKKPYLRTGPGLGDRFITSQGILFPLSGYHDYRVIEPAVGAEALTADFQLDPGKSVAGKVVGPGGEPFPGATVTGLSGGFERPATLTGATFTASALRADDTRTAAAVHAGKKLGGTATARGDGKEPPVVRLAPWGAVTGRVVDAEGNPLAGAMIRIYFEDRAASDLHQHLTDRKPATTDSAGRFRYDVPFAGVGFNLTVSHKGKFVNLDTPRRGLTVKSGETKALGDLTGKE